MGPGDFFGDCAIKFRRKHYATATSLETVSITSIAAGEMSRLLKADPEATRVYTNYLLRRSDRLEDHLRDQLFNNAEQRLARLLVRLSEQRNEKREAIVPVTLTHAELADIIGSTRSRVTKFIGNFKKRGYISCDGKITVHRSLLDSVLDE